MKKLKFKILLLLSFLWMFTFFVSAQQNKISGKVLDVSGEPIVGATILIRETNSGTITDINGNFSIIALPANTIVISYVGNNSQVIKVGSNGLPGTRR